MHIDQFTIYKVQNKLVTNSSLNYGPNQDIVNFINNLKNKIKDEPYDRNIDAVGQSRKIFAEINSQIIIDFNCLRR